MFDYPGHYEIWSKIEKQYRIIRSKEVKNDKDEKWKIKVLKN